MTAGGAAPGRFPAREWVAAAMIGLGMDYETAWTTPIREIEFLLDFRADAMPKSDGGRTIDGKTRKRLLDAFDDAPDTIVTP